MSTLPTKSHAIEQARNVSKLIRDRNHSSWNALDRSTVHSIDSLISYAERLYQLNQDRVTDRTEEFDSWCKESDDGADEEKNT